MCKVGCVIVTYNPNQKFKIVLEEILKQVDNVVIVDNGSSCDMEKYVVEQKDKIKLIKLKENKGIAYALNRGIEKCIEAKDEWILTLDHDSIVTDKMVKIMLEEYNQLDIKIKEKIAMIVPNHVEKEKYKKGMESKSSEFVLTEITSGALVKKEIYENKRKYKEELFIDLVDHEYCLYLNREKLKILKVNEAILLHHLGESKEYKIFGKSINPTNHQAIRRYYMSRNRMYVWNEYKNDCKEWIRQDKKRFISENIKILIFETKKIKKIKMIIKGIRDYKKGELSHDI